MPLDPDKLLALDIPDVEHTYGPKDCILYALGIGLGQNSIDENELAFVYEKNLKASPTFPVVQAESKYIFDKPELGITWSHTVHGEESVTLHARVAPEGTVIGRSRISDVIDKGAGKGALIVLERDIIDKPSGTLIASIKRTIFCRADGGFGSGSRPTPAPHPVPERAPDISCDLTTRPETALIYRLSGDLNPLHVEPVFAREVGFPRPILHGLASFGIVGHALLKAFCVYDPTRLKQMTCRFSAPVFPGETIRTDMWRDGSVVTFRARVIERDVIAINNGWADIA